MQRPTCSTDRVKVLLQQQPDKIARAIPACCDGRERINGLDRAEPVLQFVASPGCWCTMFESLSDPLASRWVFLWRVVKYAAIALIVIGLALGIGILGYHHIAGVSWIDSLLNASMILGGMGPVGDLPSDAAKIFASFYALFSGLVFISVMGIVLAPAAHRALHLFHLEEEDQKP